jgi:hypothetical protein
MPDNSCMTNKRTTCTNCSSDSSMTIKHISAIVTPASLSRAAYRDQPLLALDTPTWCCTSCSLHTPRRVSVRKPTEKQTRMSALMAELTASYEAKQSN